MFVFRFCLICITYSIVFCFSLPPLSSRPTVLFDAFEFSLGLKAKGRTNIELREQFILADGVSQSMSAFRHKLSSSSSQRSGSLSSAGPITKVGPILHFPVSSLLSPLSFLLSSCSLLAITRCTGTVHELLHLRQRLCSLKSNRNFLAIKVKSLTFSILNKRWKVKNPRFVSNLV